MNQRTSEDAMDLPPGFRFHPTDEELITHYLSNKVLNPNFNTIAISEINLHKCEPWDLPKRSKHGEKEWYFFCVRDRKYPTGLRANRATEAGYWKATGKDREIRREKRLVGMKKTLVFYRGRAPKGEKTDWVIHEFRLEGNSAENEWVICRVFKKSASLSSSTDEKMSLWPLMDPHVTCFSNSLFQDEGFNPSAGDGFVDCAMKTKLCFENHAGKISFEDCCILNCQT